MAGVVTRGSFCPVSDHDMDDDSEFNQVLQLLKLESAERRRGPKTGAKAKAGTKKPPADAKGPKSVWRRMSDAEVRRVALSLETRGDALEWVAAKARDQGLESPGRKGDADAKRITRAIARRDVQPKQAMAKAKASSKELADEVQRAVTKALASARPTKKAKARKKPKPKPKPKRKRPPGRRTSAR